MPEFFIYYQNMAHCPDCKHPIKTATVIKVTLQKMSTTCEQCKKPLWISENKITPMLVVMSCLTILQFALAILLKSSHFPLSLVLMGGALLAFFATLWRYYSDTVFETKK